MPSYSELYRISALPTVDLEEVGIPKSGLLLTTPSCCQTFFERSTKCLEHYKSLQNNGVHGEVKQCPYGFATQKLLIGEASLAVTSFIPFPRLGNNQERQRAKDYPQNKTTNGVLNRCQKSLEEFGDILETIEIDLISRYAGALHEIRKLNRRVKQTSERLCNEHSPGDPSRANPELVKIWKSADLMSKQFDIVELLANEEIANLQLNTTSNVYQAFDKVVRIYEDLSKKELQIESVGNGIQNIRAHDKTFPIIATVLVENAIRYGLPDKPITVSIHSLNGFVKVEVSNFANSDKSLDDTVFRRGYRGPSDKEGSGMGLYVAQLVARQHGTKIKVSTSKPMSGMVVHSFEVEFPVFK